MAESGEARGEKRKLRTPPGLRRGSRGGAEERGPELTRTVYEDSTLHHYQLYTSTKTAE